MRVFLAIDINDAVWKAATFWTKALIARLGPDAKREVKWVELKNLHITLNFFGELDGDGLAAVTKALTPPFETPRFKMILSDPGTFPAAGAVRTIWLGVRETVVGAGLVQTLFEQVQQRLRPLRQHDPEPRYSPHLTIGRVREPGGPFSRALRTAMRETKLRTPLPKFQVTHLTLYESRQTAAAPVYYPIERFPLPEPPPVSPSRMLLP